MLGAGPERALPSTLIKESTPPGWEHTKVVGSRRKAIRRLINLFIVSPPIIDIWISALYFTLLKMSIFGSFGKI